MVKPDFANLVLQPVAPFVDGGYRIHGQMEKVSILNKGGTACQKLTQIWDWRRSQGILNADE